ncbi:MAG: alpha/beta fold hydrolase [Dehalococcoidia bacterium]|nr:alpha/beta fold hydrolase [Dehalococcoidia bacterium]
MPELLVDGVSIYYEVAGTGVPLVMTHGFAGCTRMWDRQVAAFSRDYAFITYDIRGHGRSQSPHDPLRYGVDIAVNDLCLLLKHLGVDRAVVGGHSLGGILSLSFYKRHPDMVRALVLCDTGPGYRTEEKARRWNDGCARQGDILETGGMAAFADSKYAPPESYTPRDVLLTFDPVGCANVVRRVMSNPLGVIETLDGVAVPTLVLCGERDTAFLAAADYMHEHIKGSEKAIIPDAGHAANVDQPEAFNKAVLDFLKRSGVGALGRPASPPRLGFIGFGEVALHMAAGLHADGVTSICAYAKGARHRPPYSETFRAGAEAAGVRLVDTLRELVDDADVIFSTVTGQAALPVAREAAALVSERHLFVDLNNASPEVKREAAALIERAGARFVDGIIRAPPLFSGHRIPIHIAGGATAELVRLLSPYGMQFEVISSRAGDAAMIKALVEVVSKGAQALYLEANLAARKAGVDLSKYLSIPPSPGNEGVDFAVPDWLLCHGAIHAERKAGEMRHVAATLRKLGVEPVMAEAAASRLERIAASGAREKFGARLPEGGLTELLDVLAQAGAS